MNSKLQNQQTRNVIIRFDPLKTYCEYVQSKGRARSRQAYYIMMTSEKSMPEHLDMIAEFHGIEQARLKWCLF